MTQNFNFRLFIINKFFGLLSIITAVLIFLSLISHSFEDPGFGRLANYEYVSNYLGVYGSYFSSFLIIFFNKTSYIFVLFLTLLGFRLLVYGYSKLLSLRVFILFFSLVSINILLVFLDVSKSLSGLFLYDILNNSFEEFFKNPITYSLFITIMGLASLWSLFFSLNLKFSKIIYLLLSNFKFLKYIVKPFKFILSALSFLKPIYKSNTIKRSYVKKSEPTIKNAYKKTSPLSRSKNIHDAKPDNSKYTLPSTDLFKLSNQKTSSSKEMEKRNNEFSKKLEAVLKEYGVEGEVISFQSGPVVTLFEFMPAAGVKTSKVVGLSNDITRAMSSLSTRISSQPGKTTIGIEIPNQKREGVYLGDLIKDQGFNNSKSGLRLALGKNIAGEKVYTDLEKMPHLLIAGTTGSGKSVGINSMIVSLLFKFKPSECKLILIDPKMLELSIYENIPHLLTPVVTNPNKAVFALKWVVREMENRYRLMSSLNVKNIDSFNSKISNTISSGRKLYREVQTGIDRDTKKPIIEKREIPLEKLPLIVVVIDEMADLMMVSGKEVENLVQRLAQMARASGIHIIAATQRPSVDVITGTIKANFPSRISFRVASRFDSRTILNEMGAEQLLGSGDMLFLENGANLTRLHGGFVSENEIESIVDHIKSQSSYEPPKDITLEKNIEDNSMDLGFDSKDVDELYDKALDIILNQQKVSTSYIQRYLQIGYNRAARIVEKMEEDGYISEAGHSGKRSVLKKNK